MVEMPDVGVKVLVEVESHNGKAKFEGIVLHPAAKEHLTLKLANGYNASYPISDISSIEMLASVNDDETLSTPEIEFDENLTTVATLKILNPTWLQLRDEENNIVLSKLMDKDEEFSYELKLNYNITAGNAGNILVLIDDEVRGKIGKYGDILDSFVLYKDFTN